MDDDLFNFLLDDIDESAVYTDIMTKPLTPKDLEDAKEAVSGPITPALHHWFYHH